MLTTHFEIVDDDNFTFRDSGERQYHQVPINNEQSIFTTAEENFTRDDT